MLHSPYQNQINAPFGACNQGRLVQLGERKVRNLEVRGSIPLSSTIDRKAAILRLSCFFIMRKYSLAAPYPVLRKTVEDQN